MSSTERQVPRSASLLLTVMCLQESVPIAGGKRAADAAKLAEHLIEAKRRCLLMLINTLTQSPILHAFHRS